jgi:hypothetical protein
VDHTVCGLFGYSSARASSVSLEKNLPSCRSGHLTPPSCLSGHRSTPPSCRSGHHWTPVHAPGSLRHWACTPAVAPPLPVCLLGAPPNTGGTHLESNGQCAGSGPWCAHGGGLGPERSGGPTGPWLLHWAIRAGACMPAGDRRRRGLLPFQVPRTSTTCGAPHISA